MNEVEQWLEDNTIQCLQRETTQRAHPRQCQTEASKNGFMKDLCKQCPKYVAPTQKSKARVSVKFGRYPSGKGRNNV
jgi:hypothetical protein